MIITDLSSDQVKVKEVSGNDDTIASHARVCVYGFKGRPKDGFETDTRSLIKRLIYKGHTSPFEFVSMTFQVKCPIFVARQWMRHRTFRFLERSGRYCTSTNELYLPKRLQNAFSIVPYMSAIFAVYDSMIKQGVPKQEARVILPVGTYTEFIFQADLHNLLHFLRLRLHPAAQPEMRFYAKCVANEVEKHFPITWEYFNEAYLEKQND